MAKTPATKKNRKSGLNRPVIALPKPDKSEATAVTPMNFRVPETFHREFKLYAVQNGAGNGYGPLPNAATSSGKPLVAAMAIHRVFLIQGKSLHGTRLKSVFLWLRLLKQGSRNQCR